MTALPAAPGCIRATITYKTQRSTSSMSRFFLHYSGTAPTPAQLATFCDSIATPLATQMGPLMNGVNSFLPIQCEDLSSATGAVATGVVTNAGTRTGGAVAPGTALMLQFLIARRYRGGKPKIFLPLGVSADITAGGVWTPAILTSATNGWSAMITSILAAGWTGAGTLSQVNVSYYAGFSVVTNPITHRARNVPTLRGTPTVDTVTGILAETELASQRRRNYV